MWDNGIVPPRTLMLFVAAGLIIGAAIVFFAMPRN